MKLSVCVHGTNVVVRYTHTVTRAHTCILHCMKSFPKLITTYASMRQLHQFQVQYFELLVSFMHRNLFHLLNLELWLVFLEIFYILHGKFTGLQYISEGKNGKLE